jgi:hypothetical protein
LLGLPSTSAGQNKNSSMLKQRSSSSIVHARD